MRIAMKFHKSITYLACLLLLSALYKESAASTEELREKCISFGAVPGTSGFYNCMQELDRGTLQKEERKRAIEECENKRLKFEITARLKACPPADMRCAHETTERQMQACINNALGLGGDNRRNRRTCKQEGNRIICEDD
jgi:hypothetical protein